MEAFPPQQRQGIPEPDGVWFVYFTRQAKKRERAQANLAKFLLERAEGTFFVRDALCDGSFGPTVRDVAEKVFDADFLRLDRLHVVREVPELHDGYGPNLGFPLCLFRDLLHGDVRVDGQGELVLWVDIDDDEDGVRSVFRDELVDLDIARIDLRSGGVPSDDVLSRWRGKR